MTRIASDSLGYDETTTSEILVKGALGFEAFFVPLRRSQYKAHEEGVGFVIDVLRHRQRRTDFLPLGVPSEDGIRNEESFFIPAIWATSTTFLNTCLYFLSLSQSLQDALRAEPSFIPLYLQEALRLRPSTPRVPTRRLLRDFEFDAGVIPAGERVICDIRRAGRDASVFPDPETIWLNQKRPASFGFGLGQHVCTGRNFSYRLAGALVRSMLDTFDLSFVGMTQRDIHFASLYDRLQIDLRPL